MSGYGAGTDQGTDQGTDDALIEPARAGWMADPRLGAILEDRSAPWLVLDAQGATILEAGPGATGLARALADADGHIAAAIDLPGQILRAGLPEAGPRLVRLRLDARRLAVPVTALLCRGTLADGTTALLVAPTGALPVLRPRGPSRFGAESPGPAAPEPSRGDRPRPRVGDRFVWRSDVEDRLIAVTGGSAEALAPILLGQSWSGLAAAGRLQAAEALLRAIAERRTLRSVGVRLLDAGQVVDVDLSGAPLARTVQAFAGYGGFGLVRAVSGTATERAGPEPEATPPALPEDGGTPPTEDLGTEPTSGGPEAAPEPALSAGPALAALSLAALVTAARFGKTWTEAPPLPRTTGSAGTWMPPVPPSVPASEPALSVTEHDAFREIARALGARYAGDEEAPRDGGAERPEASVTPFPATRRPEDAGDAAASVPNGGARPDDAAALLAGWPEAILIYRGDAVLHANARLLALTDFPDLDALAEAGGVTSLFKGLAPHRHGEPEAGEPADVPAWSILPVPVALATRTGASRSVEIRHATVPWQGGPAECLLLREIRADDAARELAAERVAQAFREAHSADARAALDAVEDGIVTVDGAGRVVALNLRASLLFGCDDREVVGGSFVALFAAESADAVRQSLNLPGSDACPVTIGGRGPTTLDLKVARPYADGKRIATLRPRLPAAQPLAVPSAGRAQAAAGIAPTEFLAKVSHEIRTPMNGILGFTDVMLKEQFGPVGNDRYRHYLRDIHASGTHVLGLVNDLLDLATIEAGGLDRTVTALRLNDLVGACVALLQPQAARGRIVVRTSFAPDLPPLEGDERSLRQAVLNVVGNAVAYTPAGGQVIVSTGLAERGEIALRVRDTGTGMSPEEIEAALEPFRHVTVSGPRRGGGTGLGLPLTKALVEANQGGLHIASRPGEGTLVEILFPARLAMSA
ncbi:sensor histidine kinase [Methylobacterium sp. A54F]